MNDALTTLPAFGDAAVGYLIVLALCSLRVLIVMFMFPPTADGILQGPMRNGIALLWSAYVAYGQPEPVLRLRGFPLVAAGLREVLIGVAIGFAASSVFWVAESIGTYVDDLSGFNNAQVVNPQRSEQSTPTAAIMSQLTIAFFWVGGGMMFLLGAIYESYSWWPLARATPVASNILESFVLQQTDSLVQTVAKLAAPMLLVLALVDLGIGFVSKSASRLDVSSLSQPIKGAVTLLLIAIFAGVFLDQVHEQISLAGLAAEFRALLHLGH